MQLPPQPYWSLPLLFWLSSLKAICFMPLQFFHPTPKTLSFRPEQFGFCELRSGETRFSTQPHPQTTPRFFLSSPINA